MSTIFPNTLDYVIGLYKLNNDLSQFMDLGRGSIGPESQFLGTYSCAMTAFIKTWTNLINKKGTFMKAEELIKLHIYPSSLSVLSCIQAIKVFLGEKCCQLELLHLNL